MANIRKYSLGLGVVLASLLANSAVAVPLFFERIHPDTKLTRVKSSYDATTNIFTQSTRFTEAPITSALYRDTVTSSGDNITPLEWNLRAEVDESGNYIVGTGYFELFGAVDFEDASKTDLPYQQLLSGGIIEFGVGVYERVATPTSGAVNTIAYNILGLAIDSAEGIDYSGYIGMIWTDDPTPLAGGGLRTNASELWGSDWESDDGNLTRAQADIFVVPAPSSILLFGLAFFGLVRSKRKVTVS